MSGEWVKYRPSESGLYWAARETGGPVEAVKLIYSPSYNRVFMADLGDENRYTWWWSEPIVPPPPPTREDESYAERAEWDEVKEGMG